MKQRLKIASLIAAITTLAIPGTGMANTMADRLEEEYEAMLSSPFSLLPHRGTYLLPVSYNVLPNNTPFRAFEDTPEFGGRGPFVDNLEAEFQISFMVLTNRDLFSSGFSTFIGYTHRSWWQVYNADWSKPFRETNYMPELFARKVVNSRPGPLGLRLMMFDFGYIHQSNGQVQEVSRSWDRLFTRFGLAVDNVFVVLSAWYRLPEDAENDDNPDIHKYLGYGDIAIRYRYGGHDLTARLRPGESHFGGELSYSYPVKLGLRLYGKYTGGYGSSLIDYNHSVERYAFGFSLSDPFNRSLVKR